MRSRISPSSKNFLQGTSLIVIGGSLAILGCQLHQDNSDALSKDPGTLPATEQGDQSPSQALQPPNQIITILDGQNQVLVLDKQSCAAEWLVLKKARFFVTITSPFGQHTARVDTIGSAGGDGVLSTIAEVEGMKVQLPPVYGLNEQITAACKGKEGEPSLQWMAPKDFALNVEQWLQYLSPDCTGFQESTQGWSCNLPTIDPSLAKQELVGIRSTMIQRWTRRPYLLARRIAVATKLSEALTSVNFERDMGVLCRIIRHSLAIELPATISSLRWQNAACTLDSTERRQAANIGLAKTMGEIHFLRQLFERTSRIGYLTIRIPTADAPSRNLWVSLYPDEDNTSYLIEETKALWALKLGGESKAPKTSEKPTEDFEDLKPQSCWHPLFAENQSLLNLARYLDLAGDSDGITCIEPKPEEAPQDNLIKPEKYLADSIASETEFVVTNGRAKMLRLPTGKYAYKLQSLPTNPDQWDDAASSGPETTGEIDWTARRPRPEVRHW